MSFMTDKAPLALRVTNTVKLIAVGGCGLSILDALNEHGPGSYHSVAIDTDSARLAETASDSRLLVGQNLTNGFGTGGDETLGARAFSGMHIDVRELLADSKVNIIIGGLGGGTATALLPELAKISRSLGVLTLIVATRPFKYEGGQKTITAKRRMHSLFRTADSVFMINNDAISGELVKLSAAEAIKRSDAAFVDMIHGLLEFITAEKRLLLDFGTIKGQLTRGGLCSWASGVSAMRNNAIEALKTALDQFAHSRSDITKAPRALIQFAIDDDVLMDGVKNAFGVAQRVFSKDAQLAMGVVFNGVKQGKTRVSIIASGLPLFNEVVDTEIAVPDLRDEFAEKPARSVGLAMAGAGGNGGAMRSVFRGSANLNAAAENLRILNPRRLNDDELKIPAYLRRRMLGGN